MVVTDHELIIILVLPDDDRPWRPDAGRDLDIFLWWLILGHGFRRCRLLPRPLRRYVTSSQRPLRVLCLSKVVSLFFCCGGFRRKQQIYGKKHEDGWKIPTYFYFGDTHLDILVGIFHCYVNFRECFFLRLKQQQNNYQLSHHKLCVGPWLGHALGLSSWTRAPCETEDASGFWLSDPKFKRKGCRCVFLHSMCLCHVSFNTILLMSSPEAKMVSVEDHRSKSQLGGKNHGSVV